MTSYFEKVYQGDTSLKTTWPSSNETLANVTLKHYHLKDGPLLYIDDMKACINSGMPVANWKSGVSVHWESSSNFAVLGRLRPAAVRVPHRWGPEGYMIDPRTQWELGHSQNPRTWEYLGVISSGAPGCEVLVYYPGRQRFEIWAFIRKNPVILVLSGQPSVEAPQESISHRINCADLPLLGNRVETYRSNHPFFTMDNQEAFSTKVTKEGVLKLSNPWT